VILLDLEHDAPGVDRATIPRRVLFTLGESAKRERGREREKEKQLSENIAALP